MTRAEQWLIVAGAGETPKDGSTWYEKIRTAVEGGNPRPLSTEIGDGLRLESGNWGGLAPDKIETGKPVEADLPTFFARPAPQSLKSPETLSPSDLGGAKALPSEMGLDEDAAKRKGRMIHRLLEVLPGLPEDQHSRAAKRILTDTEEGTLPDEVEPLVTEARHIIDNTALAPLFGPDSLAEVPISANLPILQGQRIHGVIDRLILTPERVLAVDFKTNVAVPDTVDACPDGLLRQMGAYAHALLELYPDRKVETALLWTRTATLMHLPHDRVTAALRAAQTA
jgi:ATP-dependent helicase/nuclease subunit A